MAESNLLGTSLVDGHTPREQLRAILRSPRTAVIGVAIIVAFSTCFIVWQGVRGTDILPGVKDAATEIDGVQFFKTASLAAANASKPTAGSGTDSTQNSITSGEKPQLTVHVVGAVAQPGVYELEKGSRVRAAIQAAGGEIEGAALEAVNLARLLNDGEQVLIPTRDQLASGTFSSATGVGVGASSRGGQGGLVSLNSASAAELESLPRIGPALAESIIQWREQNGGFKNKEQLKEVRGIGEAKYKILADLVVL